jgi:hypothetical protein
MFVLEHEQKASFGSIISCNITIELFMTMDFLVDEGRSPPGIVGATSACGEVSGYPTHECSH